MIWLHICIKDVLGKVPTLEGQEVTDVILGCGQPHGAAGSNVARIATLRAGLPVTVAATTVNRFCSSGLQAIAMAAHQIMAEGVDVAIGGGVESITMMERDANPNPWLVQNKPAIYMAMGDTAEVVAKRYKVSRELQDEYSLLSQQRTARAQAEGFFKERSLRSKSHEDILDKKTGEVVERQYVRTGDECNRADTTLEGLLGLKPHFDPNSGQGTVTAGNFIAVVRWCVGDLLDVHASVRKPWGSSPSSSFVASLSQVVNRMRWESVPSLRYRNC